MRKCWKYLFYLASFTLWLVVAAALLEAFAHYQQRTVEGRNPFVLSRTQGEQWPIPDERANAFSEWLLDDDVRAQYRGAGKSEEALSPVSALWELQNRMGLFRELDDWGRQVFANVYGLQIIRVGRNEEVTRMFPVQEFAERAPLDTVLPDEEAAWLRNFLPPVMGDVGASMIASDLVFVPAQDTDNQEEYRYCIVAEPIPDFGRTPHLSPSGSMLHIPDGSNYLHRAENSWVFWRDPAVAAATGSNDLWEIPFFLYQKQVRRKEHVNVLGLTEDFYSNNHGFRDADFPAEKKEGVFRIVCVGASTTEEGPTNELTYPAIVEAMLNRHFDTDRVEVINCGISGMNALKHRMRSADYLALDPDLIIVYNAVNDICHDLFPIWVKDATPWQQRLRMSRFINQHFNQLLLPDETTMRELIEQNKMADLRFLVARAADRGVPVALCSFAAPDPELLSRDERDYYEYYTRLEWGGRYVAFDAYLRALHTYNTAIRTLCTEANLLYIPVAEQLRGGAELFGDICHLRNPGIEQKAAIIAAFLIENNVVQ